MISKEIKSYLKMIKEKHDINIKIKTKDKSKLLKALRPILEIFNKNYWDGYITTIDTTIWVPTNWDETTSPKSQLEIIAHEVIHTKQSKRLTKYLFKFLYLFPQVLALFSFLAILAIPLGSSWLWCLLFLLCAAPLPAPFRYMFELEAYRTSLIFQDKVWNSSPGRKQLVKDYIIKNLSKSDYYFTWPFPRMIQKHLGNKEKLKNKEYKETEQFLKDVDISK